MYSLVLLLAMGTSADTPAGGRGMGCNGCYGGGCYGSGCYGCYGSGYGCYGSGCCGGMGRYGCMGSSGGYGCYGSGCCGGMPGMMAPRGAEMVPPPNEKGAPPAAAAMAPATLLVHLPAEASLTINAVPTDQVTAATRKYISPPLEPGRDYYYLLQAEVVRGGQRLLTNSRVFVRAGQQSEVTLTIPVAALTQR